MSRETPLDEGVNAWAMVPAPDLAAEFGVTGEDPEAWEASAWDLPPMRATLVYHRGEFDEDVVRLRPPPVDPVLTDAPLVTLRTSGGTDLPPTGHCHDCDAPVSGERRFCGVHAATREANRTNR